MSLFQFSIIIILLTFSGHSLQVPYTQKTVARLKTFKSCTFVSFLLGVCCFEIFFEGTLMYFFVTVSVFLMCFLHFYQQNYKQKKLRSTLDSFETWHESHFRLLYLKELIFVHSGSDGDEINKFVINHRLECRDVTCSCRIKTGLYDFRMGTTSDANYKVFLNHFLLEQARRHKQYFQEVVPAKLLYISGLAVPNLYPRLFYEIKAFKSQAELGISDLHALQFIRREAAQNLDYNTRKINCMHVEEIKLYLEIKEQLLTEITKVVTNKITLWTMHKDPNVSIELFENTIQKELNHRKTIIQLYEKVISVPLKSKELYNIMMGYARMLEDIELQHRLRKEIRKEELDLLGETGKKLNIQTAKVCDYLQSKQSFCLRVTTTKDKLGCIEWHSETINDVMQSPPKTSWIGVNVRQLMPEAYRHVHQGYLERWFESPHSMKMNNFNTVFIQNSHCDVYEASMYLRMFPLADDYSIYTLIQQKGDNPYLILTKEGEIFKVPRFFDQICSEKGMFYHSKIDLSLLSMGILFNSPQDFENMRNKYNEPFEFVVNFTSRYEHYYRQYRQAIQSLGPCLQETPNLNRKHKLNQLVIPLSASEKQAAIKSLQMYYNSKIESECKCTQVTLSAQVSVRYIDDYKHNISTPFYFLKICTPELLKQTTKIIDNNNSNCSEGIVQDTTGKDINKKEEKQYMASESSSTLSLNDTTSVIYRLKSISRGSIQTVFILVVFLLFLLVAVSTTRTLFYSTKLDNIGQILQNLIDLSEIAIQTKMIYNYGLVSVIETQYNPMNSTSFSLLQELGNKLSQELLNGTTSQFQDNFRYQAGDAGIIKRIQLDLKDTNSMINLNSFIQNWLINVAPLYKITSDHQTSLAKYKENINYMTNNFEIFDDFGLFTRSQYRFGAFQCLQYIKVILLVSYPTIIIIVLTLFVVIVWYWKRARKQKNQLLRLFEKIPRFKVESFLEFYRSCREDVFEVKDRLILPFSAGDKKALFRPPFRSGVPSSSRKFRIRLICVVFIAIMIWQSDVEYEYFGFEKFMNGSIGRLADMEDSFDLVLNILIETKQFNQSLSPPDREELEYLNNTIYTRNLVYTQLALESGLQLEAYLSHEKTQRYQELLTGDLCDAIRSLIDDEHYQACRNIVLEVSRNGLLAAFSYVKDRGHTQFQQYWNDKRVDIVDIKHTQRFVQTEYLFYYLFIAHKVVLRLLQDKINSGKDSNYGRLINSFIATNCVIAVALAGSVVWFLVGKKRKLMIYQYLWVIPVRQLKENAYIKRYLNKLNDLCTQGG